LGRLPEQPRTQPVPHQPERRPAVGPFAPSPSHNIKVTVRKIIPHHSHIRERQLRLNRAPTGPRRRGSIALPPIFAVDESRYYPRQKVARLPTPTRSRSSGTRLPRLCFRRSNQRSP
jgi:hypothetical protein